MAEKTWADVEQRVLVLFSSLSVSGLTGEEGDKELFAVPAVGVRRGGATRTRETLGNTLRSQRDIVCTLLVARVESRTPTLEEEALRRVDSFLDYIPNAFAAWPHLEGEGGQRLVFFADAMSDDGPQLIAHMGLDYGGVVFRLPVVLHG
jgi:hypothetical protein